MNLKGKGSRGLNSVSVKDSRLMAVAPPCFTKKCGIIYSLKAYCIPQYNNSVLKKISQTIPFSPGRN